MNITGVAKTGVRRDLRVDAVRGVALIAMYVAHTAPTAGPGHVLSLSEYATYPLFALLVGVGAELRARAAPRRWWVGPLVRGAVLMAASEAIEGLGAQVYIVLAHLGVLTWLTAPLARARSGVVAGVGLAALAVAPVLYNDSPSWATQDLPAGSTPLRLIVFLLAGWPYQIPSMVGFAAIGILLTRYLIRPARVGDGRRLAIGLACGAVSAAWIGLHEGGAFAMEAYDVTYRVLAFDAVLIVAVTLVTVGLAGLLAPAAVPLAAMGAMSLSLYCAHIAWLAYDVRKLHPGGIDDSWTNVAVLVLGSAIFALAWRAAVRVEPWRRGPLEGPVGAVVRLLSREPARAG